MPMPRWWARMNKRVINPRELAKGERPILIHTGRVTGREHRTPLDAHRVDGGYLFVPVYGVESDWVLNVLSAGNARLLIDGADVPLTAPRLVDEDTAIALLPSGAPMPPRWLKIRHFLLTDLAA